MANNPRSSRPCILLVDDNPEEARAKSLLFLRLADARVREPVEVTARDLRDADVVLVDYLLKDWPVSDAQSLAEHPKDGVALAAVLRSHTPWDSPTAFALHSGRLDGLTGGLPPASHLHAIARMNNVEWVFSKVDVDNARPLRDQVLSLARALRRLPKTWPTGKPSRMREILEDLLCIPKRAPWRNGAWEQIDLCHPPIHELSPPTHAVTLIRWLLSSILPYATFLWDYRHLALRLRVTPNSFARALEHDRSLRRQLSPYQYTGVLSDFLGSRWWRPGIEHLVWSHTSAKSFDVGAVGKFSRTLSSSLRSVSLREPVIAFDETLRPTNELVELSDAVQLQPDDWPHYASRPWVKRDLAKSNVRLRSLAAPPL
jgi:hypothetical protein